MTDRATRLVRIEPEGALVRGAAVSPEPARGHTGIRGPELGPHLDPVGQRRRGDHRTLGALPLLVRRPPGASLVG